MQESNEVRLLKAIRAHDAAIKQTGREIWIGSEPTFTRRDCETPEWLSEPLGGDKYAYALQLASKLRALHPGCVILRTVGRQYAKEKQPRWSIGLYELRQGQALWNGPQDPLESAVNEISAHSAKVFIEQLQQACDKRSWFSQHFASEDSLDQRLILCLNATSAPEFEPDEEELGRASCHSCKTPSTGLVDTLSDCGLLLFSCGISHHENDQNCICLELPQIDEVSDYIAILQAIAEAANTAGLNHLILQGHPPPVDASVAWTTITPDPAVIEINQAPQTAIEPLFNAMRELYDAAEHIGLSPYRLQYNGTASDSGGGGQFTLGGPSATSSPFLLETQVLPNLVRYLNQHPALSYWFAPDYVGAASQSPRPDETTRDAFNELGVALAQLDQLEPVATPETLWASLASFLADPSGNSHRSELNIEKLWNPHLPGRGCLGLVEFRAFRMPYSPARATSIALLLRAVTARAALGQLPQELMDWGDELHDRFALPHYLQDDLMNVFKDLDTHGFGLDEAVQQILLNDPCESSWSREFSGCIFELKRAVEFWPLVGDVASQESGGSRLVDSSTLRLQIGIRPGTSNKLNFNAWRVRVANIEIPLRQAENKTGSLRLSGLRYRDFTPWRGLHPTLSAQGPLNIILEHPELETALSATLYNWHPKGEAYDGLPSNLSDAATRRNERLVFKTVPRQQLPSAQKPPASAVSHYTCDLRICHSAKR